MKERDETVDSVYLAERLGRCFGVFPALVTNVKDPENQGRVEIALPSLADADGTQFKAWARCATLAAGGGWGTWFMPDEQAEVLVGFHDGDPRQPYVLGSLWNGQDRPPESMDSGGRNNVRVIRSRRGHEVRLDDADGQETITLRTPSGLSLTMSDGSSSVKVQAGQNSITMDSSGVTISGSPKVTISASTIELSAGTVTVNAGMSTFSGVAKSDTVITNSVVATSYTPGAGNIW